MENNLSINREGEKWVNKQLKKSKINLILGPIYFIILNFLLVVSIKEIRSFEQKIIVFSVLSLITSVAIYLYIMGGKRRYERVIFKIKKATDILEITTSTREIIYLSTDQQEKQIESKFYISPKEYIKSIILKHDGKEYYILCNYFPSEIGNVLKMVMPERS